MNTLLQYYLEGRRVEDTDISLEYELKDYLEVRVFLFLNVCLVFEMGLTATEW